MPSITELQSIIQHWAASKDCISAAYIFGSRALGKHYIDSDLDIAVELSDSFKKIKGFSARTKRIRELEESLSELLPMKLDFNVYIDASETPNVHKGLSDGCFVAYSIDPSNLFKPILHIGGTHSPTPS